jgi:hypothetical protein
MRPSGDHAGKSSPRQARHLRVSLNPRPAGRTASRQRSPVEEKATVRPSGDQRGCVASAADMCKRL